LSPARLSAVKALLEYPVLGAGQTLSFAHRGGAGLWPENTLEAFSGSVRLGCSHLGTDLRMTRDGVIVLMHDAEVDRTTDGSGRVADLSLEELRALDAGYRFTSDGREFPRRGAGLCVPTFEELLDAHPDVGLNVEIKERGAFDLPRALFELIERRSLHDRLVVAAERHDLMLSFRRLSGTRVATGATRRECLQFWLASRLGVSAWIPTPFRALQVPVAVRGLPVVTARFVRDAHARGCAVHVWTIDEPGEMSRLLGLGVDGLMSDRPDRLVAVLHGGSRSRAGGASS